ncbi:MAG: trehalase family glycosidase, partial [Planctomycetota bacterium]
DCDWATWELAWRNLRMPTLENGFLAPYLGTAFNGAVFMWDSAFICQFADYASRALPLIRTLDVFYCKQHTDGYICREISEATGKDRWAKMEARSTGPNVLAWAEWLHFQRSGDHERLGKVFPGLLAFHRWMRLHRTWPEGGYWSCNLATGMDSQPRHDGEPALQYDHHSFMTWIDATAQALLSAECLLKCADEIGRGGDVHDLRDEAAGLRTYIDARLWNAKQSCYVDRRRDGSLADLMSIGAYWVLLTDIANDERIASLVAHLRDDAKFNRPHRVPSISASDPAYDSNGNYWCGGVWCPTNYMVLKGLEKRGEDQLAHEIAINHLGNVVQTWRDTDSLWENYAPEGSRPGSPAHADFVGWTGVAPIAILFEHVFGIRADVPNNRLVVDVRLTDEYGVQRYPFGDRVIDIAVTRRSSTEEKPQVQVTGDDTIDVDVRWAG